MLQHFGALPTLGRLPLPGSPDKTGFSLQESLSPIQSSHPTTTSFISCHTLGHDLPDLITLGSPGTRQLGTAPAHGSYPNCLPASPVPSRENHSENSCLWFPLAPSASVSNKLSVQWQLSPDLWASPYLENNKIYFSKQLRNLPQCSTTAATSRTPIGAEHRDPFILSTTTPMYTVLLLLFPDDEVEPQRGEVVCPKPRQSWDFQPCRKEEMCGLEKGCWCDNRRVRKCHRRVLSFTQQPLLERDAVVMSASFRTPSLLPMPCSRGKGSSLSFGPPAPRPVMHASVLKHDAASGSPGENPWLLLYLCIIPRQELQPESMG